MVDSENLRYLYVKGGIQKKVGLPSNLTALTSTSNYKKIKIPRTTIELI